MRNFQEEYNSLKRLHDSANLSIEILQNKNNEYCSELLLLNAKLINCQLALDINKEIMRNALTEQNQMKDIYVLEIQGLKNKIKELENDNN